MEGVQSCLKTTRLKSRAAAKHWGSPALASDLQNWSPLGLWRACSASTISDAIAAFSWDLDLIPTLLLELSDSMSDEVRLIRDLEPLRGMAPVR